MADVGQVLATGGTTIVGVAVGAGLTYWFGALNRRHQEAREDRTRWYEARFKVFTEFSYVAMEASLSAKLGRLTPESWAAFSRELQRALATIRIVGSVEAVTTSTDVYEVIIAALKEGESFDGKRFHSALADFEDAARANLDRDPTADLRAKIAELRAKLSAMKP
jgi:hypothetical protein